MSPNRPGGPGKRRRPGHRPSHCWIKPLGNSLRCGTGVERRRSASGNGYHVTFALTYDELIELSGLARLFLVDLGVASSSDCWARGGWKLRPGTKSARSLWLERRAGAISASNGDGIGGCGRGWHPNGAIKIPASRPLPARLLDEPRRHERVFCPSVDNLPLDVGSSWCSYHHYGGYHLLIVGSVSRRPIIC